MNLRPRPRMSSAWGGRGCVVRLKMLIFDMRSKKDGIGGSGKGWADV
jgi:hypothetical protein